MVHRLKLGIAYAATALAMSCFLFYTFSSRRTAEPHTTIPVVSAQLEEVLSDLPELGKDVAKLYLHPRRFVIHWKELPGSHISTKAAVGWSLAFAGLLLALYKMLFGTSCYAKLEGAAKGLDSIGPRPTPQHEEAKPQFLHLAFLDRQETVSQDPSGKIMRHSSGWSIGLGIEFPQASVKTLDEPQIASFKIGGFTIYFGNVVPSSFDAKAPQLFFLISLCVIIAVCIHLAAKLLGGTASLVQAFQVICLAVSFSLVLFSIALVLFTVLFVDVLKLRRLPLLMTYVATVLLPGFLTLFRAYLGSYSELYHLSYLRLTTASLCGIVIGSLSSIVVTPLVVLPLIYLLLRFQKFWEAIF
jgi:hypothetical protein